MASFTYKAMTEGGRLMQGTLEAGSQEEANRLLEQMPITVNSLDRVAPVTPKGSLGRQDFLLFNQQLATITKAGIPLEQSLRELSRDIASKKMRTLIADIATDLENGVPIEEAFARHEKNFPPLYSHLLRAGVETGRLGDMLTNLNRQVGLAAETKRIIVESVTYPLLLLGLMAVVTGYLYTWIIPMCMEMVREMVGGQLNAVTEFVAYYAPYVLPLWGVCGLGVLIYLLVWKILKWTPEGRRVRETVVLNFPVLGRIHHSGCLARLAETLSVTTTAGCPLPESIRVSAYATSSELIGFECDHIAEHLEAGQSILEAGALCQHVPRIFLYALQLGIQRNNVPETLKGLANMYIEQTRSNQSHLQAVLLPTMIIGLGCLLALTILSVFLPMIQVIAALGGG